MNIESIIHLANVLAGWAGVVGYLVGYILGLLFLVGLSGLCLMVLPFAWNTLKANQAAREKARQDVPETTPEAPAIPKTALKAMAKREKMAQTYDMGAKRKAWARDMDIEAEIYEMIGKVREGDAR